MQSALPAQYQRKPQKHVLLIFIDGIGIGTIDPQRNPFFSSNPPFLNNLLDGRLPSLRNRFVESAEALCIPLNATLGVQGLPQSGTGQATLYTGMNAARIIGQHFGPYLYSTLKPVVAEHNIFRRLHAAGPTKMSTAFANAFPARFFDYLEGHRKRMVAGIFAALMSGVEFRTVENLKRGTAVSADLTAQRWKDIGHPEAPVITPYEAGRNLAAISRQNHFTLFEYFLTDKAGHERNRSFAETVTLECDEFLRGVYEHTNPASTLVLVTSDHGNLEDLSTKSHTRNPVPALLWGNARHIIAPRLKSIVDVTPVLVDFLNG
jgi:2,3-bisphosphoglycerate-independent phosphoglycerate mutase